MALATNNQDEKTMATDVVAPGADEAGGGGGGRPQERPQRVETGTGFFSIHKKGQGYWTRLCTAAGAALFIIFLVSFLYAQLPPWIRQSVTPDNPTSVQSRIA